MKDYFGAPTPTFSFEIFPPKKESGLATVYAAIDALACLNPDLISVTYGAGGSTRTSTVEIVSKIENNYRIPSVAHLTCIGMTRESLDKILDDLSANGVRYILALRGDLVEGEKVGDFKYAVDLIKYIKARGDFKIFAACYPETHPAAASPEADLDHLKEKVDAGADALISQLFFDNAHFYSFLEKARAKGINVPIEAGIMPITSASQIVRMTSLCGATLTPQVKKIIASFGHNAQAMKEAGIVYATSQIVDLLASNVDGIHLYTMNQPDIAKRIAESVRGILFSRRIKRD